MRTRRLRPLFCLFFLLFATLSSSAQAMEYWSDQFVVLVDDAPYPPTVIWLDFNRGTSTIPGREVVAEFVGHFGRRDRWVDLQSGEVPLLSRDPSRVFSTGVCRPKLRDGRWTLDYDGARARFRVELEPLETLHIQRDDPQLTTHHSAAQAVLEFDGRRFPATVFHERIRWHGYNRLVGKTPPRMYGHFDWVPLVTLDGDWLLLIQDPGQARVPDDAPDHNWGVLRRQDKVVTPIPGSEFRLYPKASHHQSRHRVAPERYRIELPGLGWRASLRVRSAMLDRFGSGLMSLDGRVQIPGRGLVRAFGVVDHIER